MNMERKGLLQEDREKRMRGQTVNKQWRVKTKGEPWKDEMREKMCKERRGSDWVKSSDELRRDGDTIRANCDELYVKISRVGSKKEQESQ